MPPEFTCARCGMTSHNPQDALEGFCGRCHGWTGQPLPARPGQLLYACPRCATSFTVPPGHGEPVLCGFHSPPERMDLVSASGAALSWSRPDADPLRDIQEARRLIEIARRSVEVSGMLTAAQAAAILDALGLPPGGDAMRWTPGDPAL